MRGDRLEAPPRDVRLVERVEVAEEVVRHERPSRGPDARRPSRGPAPCCVVGGVGCGGRGGREARATVSRPRCAGRPSPLRPNAVSTSRQATTAGPQAEHQLHVIALSLAHAADMPWTYILRCGDGTLYVGSTRDLDLRMEQHCAGRGAAYTSRRLPVELVWCFETSDVSTAWALERKLHGWSRAKREALIDGRFDLLPMLARRHEQRGRLTWRGLETVARAPSRRPLVPHGLLRAQLTTSSASLAGYRSEKRRTPTGSGALRCDVLRPSWSPRRSWRSRRSWRAARQRWRRPMTPWCRRRRPAWWPR